MSEFRTTLNQARIYSIAIVVQYATSLVMLPIYTRYLTPGDYGIAEMLSMGVELIGLLVGVVTGQTLFRYYYDKENEEHRKQVVFTSFFVGFLANLCGFFIIILLSGHAADFLFSEADVVNGRTLVILFGASLVFQVMTAMPMAYIRAIQRPGLYVAFSILRLGMAVSANLYFVVYRELHVEGVIYATFTFTCIHGTVLSIYLLRKVGVNFSLRILREILVFSWPLMVATIALFLSTYADRVFLKIYAGVSAVGIYSLAYKFGFILVVFAWTPFGQAWDARRYEVAKLPNAIEIYQSTFRATQIYVVFAALALSVLSRDFIKVMADVAFWQAGDIVGIIILAYVFNIWTNYCIFGILYRKKTKYKAYAEWISVVLSIVLYASLIPGFGIYGAAMATLLSLALRFILIYHWATKLYDMQLEWPKILFFMLLAILLYLTSYTTELSLLYSVPFNIMLLFVFVVCAVKLPIYPEAERKNIALIFTRPAHTIRAVLRP